MQLSTHKSLGKTFGYLVLTFAIPLAISMPGVTMAGKEKIHVPTSRSSSTLHRTPIPTTTTHYKGSRIDHSRAPGAKSHLGSHYRSYSRIHRGPGYSCYYSYHPSCYSWGYGRGFRYYSYPYPSLYFYGFYPYSLWFDFWWDPWYGYPYYPYGYPYRYYGWWRSSRGEYDTTYLEYRTGEIWFDVQPSSAEIFVDNEFWGPASELNGWWNSQPLEKGEHKIRITAPGYETIELPVVIRGKGKEAIRVRLRQTGNLSQAIMSDSQERHQAALIIRSESLPSALELDGNGISPAYDESVQGWIVWTDPGLHSLRFMTAQGVLSTQQVRVALPASAVVLAETASKNLHEGQ